MILCVAGLVYQSVCQVHFAGRWDMGWTSWGQYHLVYSSRGPVHCSLPKESVGDLSTIFNIK